MNHRKSFFAKDNFIAEVLLKMAALFCAVIMLFVSMPITSYATDSTKQQLENAKKAKEQTQGQLDDTKDDIVDNLFGFRCKRNFYSFCFAWSVIFYKFRS